MWSIYLRDRKKIIDGASGPAIYFVCLHDFVGFLKYVWLFFSVCLKWLGSGKTAGDVEGKEKFTEEIHNPNGIITPGLLPN